MSRKRVPEGRTRVCPSEPMELCTRVYQLKARGVKARQIAEEAKISPSQLSQLFTQERYNADRAAQVRLVISRHEKRLGLRAA